MWASECLEVCLGVRACVLFALFVIGVRVIRCFVFPCLLSLAQLPLVSLKVCADIPAVITSIVTDACLPKLNAVPTISDHVVENPMPQNDRNVKVALGGMSSIYPVVICFRLN